MSNLVKFTLVGLVAVVVFQLFAQRATAPVVGSAPPLALPDLAGQPVDLAAYRGRVVAVNFWATWCGPCRLELPDLARFRNDHAGKCLEILGVAEESGREDLLAIAPKIPYPILVDERATALDAWGVQAYPKTFIVDPQGNVRKVFSGAVSRDDLEAAITPLVPETCVAGG